MTEFEAATIAYQQASLAAQQAGNDIALWATYVQAGAAVVVGLLQAGIVVWGIRAMTTESAKRGQEHAARHTETMETLRQQGEALRQQGEASRQQGEALRQQGEALRQQGEALRQQGEALRTLIERTAPTIRPTP